MKMCYEMIFKQNINRTCFCEYFLDDGSKYLQVDVVVGVVVVDVEVDVLVEVLVDVEVDVDVEVAKMDYCA